ncbi:MAG: hypothetical protein EGQ84_03850 [Slackia sp.]|nr:hypothetical protein [Slackia sp.]
MPRSPANTQGENARHLMPHAFPQIVEPCLAGLGPTVLGAFASACGRRSHRSKTEPALRQLGFLLKEG